MLAIALMAAQATQPVSIIEPSKTILEPAPAAKPEPDFEFSLEGSCVGNEGPVEMHRLWLLQDREVTIKTSDGPLKVTVERDKLKIAETNEEGEKLTRVWETGYIVGDGGQKLDLQLNLGVLESNLVVHWRETFQNRIYRQGLFRVAEGEVAFLCEGHAGVNVTH